MIFRSATIASTLLLLGWSSASSQALPTSSAKSPGRCPQPIGRVIGNGDSRLPAGTLLCQGDRLQPIGSAKVEVLCYLNRQVLSLPQGKVSSQCSPLKQQEQSLQCTRHNRAKCPKRKGPTLDNAPTLISPYSSLVLDIRPDLIWTPIAGITSYKVQVTGVGVDWSQIVVGNNQLAYPPHHPPLKFGNAYKITIIANQGNSPVAASLATINVVNQNKAQYIKQIVQRVNSFNLSPDQAAYLDLDNLYMSYGLLTEAIEVLKARVEAGSKLPEIHTALGDRYLEAGLPNVAKPLYQNAIGLAQKVDNSTQIQKAQAGLKKIELYSQLPTKIKLDQ